MSQFSRTEQSGFDKMLKMDQWEYDFEPYKEAFEEGWEDITKWGQIPVIGNIIAWASSGGTTYDQEALEEMGNWEQWDVLFDAEDDIIEGYAEAEDEMQSMVTKAGIQQTIELAMNLIAPGTGEFLGLGGDYGTILRNLVGGKNYSPGNISYEDGVATRMNFGQVLMQDLQRLGIKKGDN